MLAGAYRHSVTYWAPNPLDGFGNRSFAAPVLLKARWQDRTDLNVGNTQEFKPSKAQVHLQQAVELGGYLAKGDYAEIDVPITDPTTLTNAHMILRYDEIPSVQGNEYNRKALM